MSCLMLVLVQVFTSLIGIIIEYLYKMQCTFCRGKLYRELFTCQSHPEVISCRGCRQYDCYRCKAEFRKVQLQFCSGCKQYQPTKNTFITSSHRFCLNCCLKAYKNTANGKKVILCRHICQPDKYEVYLFLKRYCNQCKTKLASEPMEYIDSGVKQIYPLDLNICQKCANEKSSKQNNGFTAQTSKKSHYQVYKEYESKQLKETKSNFEPQRTFTTKRHEPTAFEQQRFAQSAQEKWRRIQNTDHLRCLSCGNLILSDGLVTDNLVICKFCIKWSNQEEKQIEMKNSREVRRSHLYNDPQPINLKRTHQTSNNNSVKFESGFQQRQERRLTTKESKLNPDLENKKSVVKNAGRQNIGRANLKKMRSEEEPMLNFPISVRYVDQSDLVQCSNCGIRMEGDASIWEEKYQKYVCRCCFADKLQQLKHEKQRYQSPPKQDISSSGLNGFSSKTKNYVQPQKQKSPSTNRLHQGANQELQTQPVIRQQIQNKLNKVKRTQSWDQSIIVEPIEEHYKRKQKKNRKEQNIINQQPNQQQKADQGKLSFHQNNVSTNSKEYKTASQLQESSQPTIIQQSIQTKPKLKKMESWDEQIVLQPVLDHAKRKEQQNKSTQGKQKGKMNPNSREQKNESEQRQQYQKREEESKEEQKIKRTQQKKDQASTIEEMDQKYKQKREKLEKQINSGFSNMERPYAKDSSKNSLNNSRSTTYSNYFQQKQKLSQSRQRPPYYGSSSYDNPYYGYYQRDPYSSHDYKRQNGPTRYQTYSSRKSEYYQASPRTDPYVSRQWAPQHNPTTPQRQNLTGFRMLDRKAIKVCELCRIKYETGFKDYYFQGYNVCLPCFNFNNNPR